jgi:hypothetical protein
LASRGRQGIARGSQVSAMRQMSHRIARALSESVPIKIDPNFAGSYINRGVILHRKIEFNLALAAVNQAIRVDPSIFDVIRRMNLRP